jgi:hypothetical protein
VALAATAPAERALEFAREAHTAGPFVHTPAYFYDPDDLNFGFDDQTCLGGSDWGDVATTAAARQLLRGRLQPRCEWERGPGRHQVRFWVAQCFARPIVKAPSIFF